MEETALDCVGLGRCGNSLDAGAERGFVACYAILIMSTAVEFRESLSAQEHWLVGSSGKTARLGKRLRAVHRCWHLGL